MGFAHPGAAWIRIGTSSLACACRCRSAWVRKGEASIAVGYYDLFSEYVRIEHKSSSLAIKALAFNNHVLEIGNPQKEVDKALSEIEGQGVLAA